MYEADTSGGGPAVERPGRRGVGRREGHGLPFGIATPKRTGRESMRRYLVLALAAAVLGTGAPPATAQIVDPYAPQYYRPGYRAPRQQNPYYAPQPQGYRGQQYYPGMLVQPAPQRQPEFSLRRLFGYEEERRAPRPAPRYKPKPPAPAVAKEEKPKVDPSTYVVVFGDALADQTGQGLEEAFSDEPEVAVVRKARSDLGLARDGAEWPKAIQEALNGGQKITLALMMLGTGERAPIKEGDATYEPLSDRWKELYRERVDAVVRTLQDRGVPVVWVGIPPMKNDKLSTDYVAINEIYRESVERLGGSYVDIWPGFVDDDNRYTASGPNVDGEVTRLRANDGVLFTRAGARKAAHFADTEIKRVLAARRGGAETAATRPAESVDQVINAAVPAPGDPPGAPASLAPKPVAGPVLPLTGKPELSPGGTLVNGRSRVNGDAAHTAEKALRDGIVPGPRPGRADDFRWPRS
jgi:hypothetical protein